MRSPCCLCIPPYQLLNASTNLYETWYAYHGTWAHFNGVLRKSLPSVCVSVCVSLIPLSDKGSVKYILPFFARQRLSKHVPAATNIHVRNDRRIVGRVIFYAVSFLSKEGLWDSLYIPLLLLRNNSVKSFPRKRRIVGGVVFHEVRVASKESRRLFLPRTSCYQTVFSRRWKGEVLFVSLCVRHHFVVCQEAAVPTEGLLIRVTFHSCLQLTTESGY
jgi:hypothetical protein